jgi:hypothetical protein
MFIWDFVADTVLGQIVDWISDMLNLSKKTVAVKNIMAFPK